VLRKWHFLINFDTLAADFVLFLANQRRRKRASSSDTNWMFVRFFSPVRFVCAFLSFKGSMSVKWWTGQQVRRQLKLTLYTLAACIYLDGAARRPRWINFSPWRDRIHWTLRPLLGDSPVWEIFPSHCADNTCLVMSIEFLALLKVENVWIWRNERLHKKSREQ
jgi:hypothetical protein